MNGASQSWEADGLALEDPDKCLGLSWPMCLQCRELKSLSGWEKTTQPAQHQKSSEGHISGAGLGPLDSTKEWYEATLRTCLWSSPRPGWNQGNSTNGPVPGSGVHWVSSSSVVQLCLTPGIAPSQFLQGHPITCKILMAVSSRAVCQSSSSGCVNTPGSQYKFRSGKVNPTASTKRNLELYKGVLTDPV